MTSELDFNRRTFLTGTAAVAATSLASTRARAASSVQATAQGAAERADMAAQIRHTAADKQRQLTPPTQPGAADEVRYASKIGSFGKGLPHNDLGEVDRDAFAALVAAIESQEPADFERIPLGGTTKLVNPQAAFAFDLQGVDSHALAVKAPPPLASAEIAAEMVENYWHVLARDIPHGDFMLHDGDYMLHDWVVEALNELSGLTQYQGPKVGGRVTPDTIFRIGLPGVSVGPYLSQFLVLDVPYGAMKIRQQYRVRLPGQDYLADYGTWLACQRGAVLSDSTYDPQPRYIRNNRDMAECVHHDLPYQPYLNAALILLGQNTPFDAGNPYIGSATQKGDATFGATAILDLIARITSNATKTASYLEWVVHRRLRPEEYGGRLFNKVSGAASYPLHAQVLNSRVVNQYNMQLLPMAYPGGCPANPSHPSAHAVIAGAAVTVLKAFFDESAPILAPKMSNRDGTALETLDLNPGTTLTVGAELNKLAGNISIAGCAAGVQWRSDCDHGLSVGEALALNYLGEMRALWNERFGGFTVTKFDGTTVRV